MKIVEPLHDLSYQFINWLMLRLGAGYISHADLFQFQSALEKRYSIEYLLQQIEKVSADNGGDAATKVADNEPVDQ